MNWFVSFLVAVFRPVIGLISMTGLLLFWVLKRKLLREHSLKSIAYIFSGAIISQSIFSTILNWWLWSQQQGITQRLLPPHSSIAYVLKYSWQHYWFEPVIVIFAAIVVFFSIYFLNKKFENQLFYDEEKYLAALGILATGWPNCLIYLCLVLFLGVIFHFLFLCFNSLKQRKRRGDVAKKTVAQADLPAVARRAKAGRVEENISRTSFRLSLLPFWLPCALLVLLLGDIISKYLGITQLII